MPKSAQTIEDYDSLIELDHYSLFINATPTDQTKRKYQARLNVFFDYISILDTNIEKRCKVFLQNCRDVYNRFSFV
jgi:hypothetical protein